MQIRILRLIGVLVGALALPACAGQNATATPLPLSQTFQSSDGSIHLNYPDGWVANDLLGQVTVASSQAAIDAEAPAPGYFQVRLFATPLSAIEGLPANAGPRDVLGFFAESLSTSGVTFNASDDLSINGRTGAKIAGSGMDGQGVVIALDLGEGNYVFATATSALSEMARFEPTLLAILGTLTYTAPAS